MKERIKSPVVWIQLITIVGTALVVLDPSLENSVKEIVGIIATIINVFAGLNNPTSRTSF